MCSTALIVILMLIFQSWQDWRSDTKAKAALFKRESNKTGGGKINPKAKALTPLEEQLLGFLGPNLVGGHEEVMDPLVCALIVVTP